MRTPGRRSVVVASQRNHTIPRHDLGGLIVVEAQEALAADHGPWPTISRSSRISAMPGEWMAMPSSRPAAPEDVITHARRATRSPGAQPPFLPRRGGQVPRTPSKQKEQRVEASSGSEAGKFAVVTGASSGIGLELALQNELKDTDVTITSLIPGPTETEFFERADMMDTDVGTSEKDEAAQDKVKPQMHRNMAEPGSAEN